MTMLVRTSVISLCLLCLACTIATAQQIRYVNVDAAFPGDGRTWETAFTDLQMALSAANAGDEIWVAKGQYLATSSGAVTFDLKNDVALYGGFVGGESDRNDRDPALNRSHLRTTPGFEGPVVTSTRTNRGAVLDGFVISGATGNVGGGLLNRYGTPVLRNLTFESNTASRGGAIASVNGNPLIANCTFVNNEATWVGQAYGGAIYVQGGSVAIYNSRFVGNRATGQGSIPNQRFGIGRGGAAYFLGAKVTIVNTLFAENEVAGQAYVLEGIHTGLAEGAAVYAGSGTALTMINTTVVGNVVREVENVDRAGGGLVAFGALSRIVNSIFWRNDLEQIVGDGARVQYTVVESGYLGESVYRFNPKLTSNHTLDRYSYAIDAGQTFGLPPDSLDLDNDKNYSEPLPVDANGGPRVVGSAVDLGFLEYQDPVEPAADGYFPIQLGNSWTYYRLQERHDAPPDTVVGLPRAIVDTFTVDGLLYHRAPHPNSPADSLRYDGGGRVFALHRGRDVLLYDFTLEEGAKYFFVRSAAPADTFEVTVERNITVTVEAGQFENCIRLTFDRPLAVDGALTFVFAPSVGIVLSYDGMGDGSYLHHATIDGRIVSKQKSYLPLAVGNSWTYETMSFSITDTVVVNDTLYYIGHHPFANADTLRDDGRGRIRARKFNRDILLYDFTLADAQVYDSDLPPLFPDLPWQVTVARNQGVETAAGRFEDCIGIYFNAPRADDDEHGFVFAPGVGIVVAIGYMGWREELRTAVLGGKVVAVEDELPHAQETAVYPNPFRESTTLRFPNRGATSATATVYDVLGRSVAKLATNECTFDGCIFRWDGRAGSNGLYFVVSDGDSREVVSVVLAR